MSAQPGTKPNDHTAPPDTQPGTQPDTQWPRWEVFKQDADRKPHQAVGSVHAADPEHALLMARTVFARRPAAVSMWVVPADSIHSWTAEELERLAAAPANDAEPAPPEPEDDEHLAAPAPVKYVVVVKASNRRSMTFGDVRFEVQGATLKAALGAAMAHLANQPVLALWLVESAGIVRSDPDVADPWFGPAVDKTYKQQAVYSSVATAKRDAERGKGR